MIIIVIEIVSLSDVCFSVTILCSSIWRRENPLWGTYLLLYNYVISSQVMIVYFMWFGTRLIGLFHCSPREKYFLTCSFTFESTTPTSCICTRPTGQSCKTNTLNYSSYSLFIWQKIIELRLTICVVKWELASKLWLIHTTLYWHF